MTTADILSIIVVANLIAVLGQALDNLLKSGRLATWRNGVGHLWVGINTPGAKDLTQDAHRLFRELFDAIYGPRAFSARRVIASALFTLIALAALILILGYEKTFWRLSLEKTLEPAFDWELFLIIVVLPLVLNLVPGFLSVAETRWVLRRAEGMGLAGVGAMMLVDIGLTLNIFLLGLVLVYAIVQLLSVFSFADPGHFSAYTLSTYLEWVFAPSGGLIFLLSTYVTSVFWQLYFGTFVLIRLLPGLLPAANYIYLEVSRSERPFLVTSGLVNSLVVFGFFCWQIVAWILRD